ncbi:uncharacterized protein LOC120432831 [Oreochromis aureus]|uniref:uncharacterized protein LOC120432831 n=1 Tax=Oreochromis aureus TaxID=47969 RepID=UPI001953244E|nr:uncharacterized protein LOC120432831 [Oreochromis aureus]
MWEQGSAENIEQICIDTGHNAKPTCTTHHRRPEKSLGDMSATDNHAVSGGDRASVYYQSAVIFTLTTLRSPPINIYDAFRVSSSLKAASSPGRENHLHPASSPLSSNTGRLLGVGAVVNQECRRGSREKKAFVGNLANHKAVLSSLCVPTREGERWNKASERNKQGLKEFVKHLNALPIGCLLSKRLQWIMLAESDYSANTTC